MATKEQIEREAMLDVGRRAAEDRDRGPHLRIEGGLGGSPVPVMEQLRQAAITLLTETLTDGDGALRQILEQDIRMEQHLFAPLVPELVTRSGPEALRAELLALLGTLAQRPLSSDAALVDFTRRVDAAWGRLYSERPRFQKPGQPAATDDPYTHESVRAALSRLVSLATKR